MLTVHHLRMSQSDRIVWLCEELGLDYALKLYNRDPVSQLAPQDYKALSPAGTAPVITDGNVTLGETNAILEYIVGRYGGGDLTVAPDDPDYPDYLFWLHFSNGSFMPALLFEFFVRQSNTEPADVGKSLAQRVERAYALIEDRLAKAPYLGGERFTLADIVMLFPLTTGRLFNDRDISGLPNLRGYLRRVTERDGFKRAMAKADPDLPIKID